MYQPQAWVPKPVPVEAFLISLDSLNDLKILLGASSIETSYHRNQTILIEWTMMHRETFSGLVGQYIVRNHRGQVEVLDAEDLVDRYTPYVETNEVQKVSFTHDVLGRLVAVQNVDGEIREVLFERPDGTPLTLLPRAEDEVSVESATPDKGEAVQERKVPTPTPPKHQSKESNDQ